MKTISHFYIKYLLTLAFSLSASIISAQQKFNPALKKQLDSIGNTDQQYRGILSDLMTPGRPTLPLKH